MIKNVVVGKGGLLTKLDPRRWSSMGGGFDWINLLAIVAGHNPNVEFWVASKADFKSDDLHVYKRLFPYGNVHFKTVKFKPGNEVPLGAVAGTPIYAGHVNQFVDWIDSKGVKIDAGLFDVGIASRINLPNRVPKITEPDKFAKPSVIAYAMSSGTIQAINVFAERNPDFKWVSVHFDPKCDMIQRDLDSDPVASFAQHDYSYETERHRGGKFVPVKFHHRYLDLAATAAFGIVPPKVEDLSREKTVDFAMALNGMNPTAQAQNRWPKVKAALEAIDEIAVYGNWEESFVPESDRHWLTSGKFMGVMPKPDLDREMRKWRTTLLSPTGPGWVTAKFYECLIAGVVPLFAPDYDTGRHLKVPQFMRLADLKPETLASTVKNCCDVWLPLMSHLRERHLSDDVRLGTSLNDAIMREIDPSYAGGTPHPSLGTAWKELREEIAVQTAGLDFV